MKLFLPRLLVLLVAAATLPGMGRAQTLTKAIEIRSLSVARAQENLPVRVRGVVVFMEPSSVFVQDETSTTYFRPPEGISDLHPGDEIEVEGFTRMGLFLPGIGAARFQVLQRGGPRPRGIPASYDDLVSARLHYQRVTVEGVVRSLVQIQEGRSSLRLAMGSRILEVRVESALDRERAPIDGRVRIQGLAAGFANDRRQVVQVFVQVIDWDDVTIVEPPLPAAAAPRISPEELRAFRVSGHGDRRVRIEGTVTAVFPRGQVFLRSDDMAFDVRFAATTPTLAHGDRLEVIGFPEMDRFSASVVDAELLRQEPGPPPAPLEVDSPDRLGGVQDSDLVAVTATVRNGYNTDRGLALLLEGQTRTIQADLADTSFEPIAGSRVRITGICLVEAQDGGAGFFKSRPVVVKLRLRSAADLEVLQKPSWWTARRLSSVLEVAAGITLLAGLWIAVLRRQVARQTAALRRKIEAEAALEERQRIAREFHDTLEQELAGVSLRLDAFASRELDPKGRDLIGAARSLVSRIQRETRDLISDLRDPSETAGDLLAALATLAARESAESATVRIEPTGQVPVLPAGVVHNLRMIARESLTNAVRHGGATHVAIQIETQPTQLVMRIVDNGRGFDLAAIPLERRTHFGRAGIRERARKLDGTVEWRSTLGTGTTVEVALPLASPFSGEQPEASHLDLDGATPPPARVSENGRASHGAV